MTNITPEMRQAAFDACAGATGRMVDAILIAAYPLIRAQVLEEAAEYIDKMNQRYRTKANTFNDFRPVAIDVFDTCAQAIRDMKGK